MANKKLHIQLISPNESKNEKVRRALRPFKNGIDVDMIIVRAFTGDFGILPGRAPCALKLGSGELRVFNEGNEKKFMIDGGLASVEQDIVTVLTDSIELVEAN